ncbi:hypothetical protein KP509_21G049300 [Ceratopteris richardii]|uniref:Uncharacterized protein n=1 Tax=Ceratopteris richardii TaxID=49495 RepID=A0A8T2SD43_CERRI|nr:hypothetical protein KP509_21G049300 [Ceratopteris richardii]
MLINFLLLSSIVTAVIRLPMRCDRSLKAIVVIQILPFSIAAQQYSALNHHSHTH